MRDGARPDDAGDVANFHNLWSDSQKVLDPVTDRGAEAQQKHIMISLS